MFELVRITLGAALTEELRDLAPASWEISKRQEFWIPLPHNLAGKKGSPLETYVLIGHVPVGPLPVGHHLPHDDAIAPHIAGRGELPVLNGFWGRPTDGDLPTLWKRMRRVNGREAGWSGLCSLYTPPCALSCINCVLLFPKAASDSAAA